MGSTAYGCRICNWDACEKCYGSPAGPTNNLSTPQEINEAFVFSMGRKEFLNKQVKNTNDYYYYTILDMMSKGQKLNKEQQKLLL